MEKYTITSPFGSIWQFEDFEEYYNIKQTIEFVGTRYFVYTDRTSEERHLVCYERLGKLSALILGEEVRAKRTTNSRCNPSVVLIDAIHRHLKSKRQFDRIIEAKH